MPKHRKCTKKYLSEIRSAAGKKGLAARWAGRVGPSRRVRVDAAAAAALDTLPEVDRRRVATAAILSAVGGGTI